MVFCHKINRKAYLTINEVAKKGKGVLHKSHIVKCMFLIALARPRYLKQGKKEVSNMVNNLVNNYSFPMLEGIVYTSSINNNTH